MKTVRFTFVHDRFNRAAVASLIAALEDLVGDPQAAIRTVSTLLAEHVGIDPACGVSEVFCFSTMTANAPRAIALHGRLRAVWGRAFTSICGGSHAAGDPRSLLEAGFDYCCMGEGEDVIREVYRHAVRGEPLKRIRGLLHLEGGEVRGRQAATVPEIECYSPLPLKVQFPTHIEIGRGCRWRCLYCQTPHLHGRHERFRSPGRVEEVVRRYASFGMRDYRFLLPNTLGYMSDRAGAPNCEALDELLDRTSRACGGGRVFLGSFPSEVRPDYVTERALRVLKKYVSNKGLVIGGQSGSRRILETVKRGHGVDAILRACDVSTSCDFEPSVDLMLGFPGETADDRAATLDLVEHLGAGGAVTNMHFFMPLPGTDLADAQPVFLDDEVRRKLDRFGQQGILRGRWRRQEEISRTWASR
jgi:B12-binding domain/radical SAM domain protein